MERIIGIDLGTTNSLGATVFDEGPEVIEASGESTITPSVLSLTDKGWLVGEEALNYSISYPDKTIFSVKRLMGRSLKDLENIINELPYKIIEAQRQLIKIKRF